MKRTPMPPRAKPMPRRRTTARAWSEVRWQIFDRAQGNCEWCGTPLDPHNWHCHHRKLRAQGGTDSPPNLLALHPDCHEEAHLHPRWARYRGLMTYPTADPATVPFVHHRDGRVYLTADNGYRKAETA